MAFPPDPTFAATLVTGGDPQIRASIIRTNPGGLPTIILAGLELLPGSEVTVDGAADVRRSFRGAIADPTGALAPKVTADPLAPFGNELVVEVGFRFPSGAIETVPQGVFRLDTAESTDDGRVALTGRDRASVVMASKFETPWTIPAGTNLADAVAAIISSRYPGALTYNFAATPLTLPLTVFEEGSRSGDPWRNASDLALAGGYHLYFNRAGQPTMAPIPNPTAESVGWVYSPGDYAMILGVGNTLSSVDVPNVVVLQIEGTGQTQPWRSVAEVTDPASPIWPSGAYGRRPKFVVQSSPIITAQAQIDVIAAGLLRQYAGGAEQLVFTAAPNPWHDADDIVLVHSPLLAGGSAFAVLASFTLDVSLHRPVSYVTAGRRSV